MSKELDVNKMRDGDVVYVDGNGDVIDREPSPGLSKAKELGLTRKVVFEEHDVNGYSRPYEQQVARFQRGEIGLGDMTPAYAHAMVWADLKAARTSAKGFKAEMNLARLWKEKLGELATAFGLPEDHFDIDISGPVLHVHPVETPGVTLGSNGRLLNYSLHSLNQHAVRAGRGFEAILPTHIQATGYATPAHPEMDANLSAIDAIPSLRIGKYVRVGGAFNPQGSEKWVFGDNCWLGQGCYFISQEHDAARPSQLARTRQETNFPGMTVGEWAWIAKGANILYRTQYVGKGAVVGAYAKINRWVGDCALVSGDDRTHAYYPVKSWVIDTLGIRDTQDVLALDWDRVEQAWQKEYEVWRNQDHAPDDAVDLALNITRQNPTARVLFIGANNPANILRAVSAQPGEHLPRQVDVMTTDTTQMAYVMQALNGMRVTSVRFRGIEDPTTIPLARFYEEPQYDLTVIETDAETCVNGGDRINQIVDEARRLTRPNGIISGAIRGISKVTEPISPPAYVTVDQTTQIQGDMWEIHAQGLVRNIH